MSECNIANLFPLRLSPPDLIETWRYDWILTSHAQRHWVELSGQGWPTLELLHDLQSLTATLSQS